MVSEVHEALPYRPPTAVPKEFGKVVIDPKGLGAGLVLAGKKSSSNNPGGWAHSLRVDLVVEKAGFSVF